MALHLLESKKAKYIDMDEYGISYRSIRTDALSSCICLLMDGMIGIKPFCYLSHSSKCDDNAADTSEELLILLMEKLSINLKNKLKINSLCDETNPINKLTLLVGGGAKGKNDLTRKSFSLLNNNINIDVIEALTDDEDIIHLCKELLNSIIIIKPITYFEPDENDEKGR